MTAAKLRAHGYGSCAWPHTRTPTAYSTSDSFLRIDIDIPAVVLRLKCSAQPLPRPRLLLVARPLSIACYPTRTRTRLRFGRCVSAARRSHPSTTDPEHPSQSRYCASSLSLTPRALRIASKRCAVPSRPCPAGASAARPRLLAS